MKEKPEVKKPEISGIWDSVLHLSSQYQEILKITDTTEGRYEYLGSLRDNPGSSSLKD